MDAVCSALNSPQYRTKFRAERLPNFLSINIARRFETSYYSGIAGKIKSGYLFSNIVHRPQKLTSPKKTDWELTAKAEESQKARSIAGFRS